MSSTITSTSVKTEHQPLTSFTNFDDMPHLHAHLLRGIYSFGFEKPSNIQQKAIVPIAEGGDVIVQASAGQGKTGAFAIGFLARLDVKQLRTQVLVLSPTRELARQTYDVTLGLGSYMFESLLDNEATPVALLSSNVPLKDNYQLLSHTSTKGNGLVAVGTPGRIIQLLEKGVMRPDHLKTLVQDEADELFSQGFQEQIARIFQFMPRDVQMVLVSATLPDEVRELTEKFMRNPTRILVQPEDVPVASIKQYCIDTPDVEVKMLCLFDLYERISIAQSIIFVNSRRRAEHIAKEMNARRFTVAVTHGELNREERDAVLEKFKRGESRVLVSTDLIGRGIDCYHVNLVINFEMPTIGEKYIHRIGRCGRYGRKGAAINLISKEDLPLLREIESKFSITTKPLPANFTSDFAA